MLSYLFFKHRFDRKTRQLEKRVAELESRCERMSEALVAFGTSAGMKYVDRSRGRSQVEVWGLSDPPVYLGKEKSSASASTSTAQTRSTTAACHVDPLSVVYVDHDDTPARASQSSGSSHSHHCGTSHHSHGHHGGFDHGCGGHDSGSSFDSFCSSICD